MAEDFQRRAATMIDDRFMEDHRAMTLMHRQSQQTQLAYHKGRLQSYDSGRDAADARYVQRMRSIEDKRDRIADKIHQQHRSVGGRLASMTKAGREKQADQIERLNERAAQLQGRATRVYNGQTERREQAKQQDRYGAAQEIKRTREDHVAARHQHLQRHTQNRDAKVLNQASTLKRQAAEQAWKREMRQTQQQEPTRRTAK